MCIICSKTYTLDITYLNCNSCKNIRRLPDNLINLKYLNCENTNISSIPNYYINLKYLNIRNCLNITIIPKHFYNLEKIVCSNTQIKTLPNNLYNLKAKWR